MKPNGMSRRPHEFRGVMGDVPGRANRIGAYISIRRAVIAALLSAIALAPADGLRAGPFDLSLSWFLIKDDNAFRSRTPYDELVNTYALYAGKTLGSAASSFRLYYNGDLSRYSTHEDRQHNSHQAGVVYRNMMSPNVTGTLGLSGRMRRNESQYIYYNVDTYNLFANIQYEPDLATIYTFGMTYDKNKFREFAEIDNIEYGLFGRYQHFFRNRTSLAGEIGIGVKNYTNQYRVSYFGQTPFTVPVPRYTEERIRTAALSAGLNIGRSLTAQTGINAEFGARRYLGDPIEVIAGDVYYYTESDLYDDKYGYENERIALALTRQFGVGFQAKIGVSHQNKRYLGTPAFTAQGELSGLYRKDRQTDCFLFINKTFQPSWRVPARLSAFIKLNFRVNPSNDPYYDYNDQLGIIGLSLGL